MIGVMKNRAEEWFKELRGRLISMIEKHDQGTFQKKEWKHSGSGGGLMSIIKGDLIERVELIFQQFQENSQKKCNSVYQELTKIHHTGQLE